MSRLLTIDRLSVGFATRRGMVPALRDVSLSLDKGEVLGVVGESGAGKSLTGRAVLGLLEPPGQITGGAITLGETRLDTLDEETMRPIRGKRIGAVFQDPMGSLDPLMTIGDQLIETIRTHLPLNASQAKDRAAELLETVGLPGGAGRLRSHPHTLSGGMRQRVVIALALAADPDLIIADEPTTALDVSVQAQIVDLLSRLCRERHTAMILITHDMGVIAAAAQRVAVLYAGMVVEEGPVGQVLRAPRHPYTRGLMAAIPRTGGGRGALHQIPGSMPALGAWPEGCPFHPRCEAADDRCRSALPGLDDFSAKSDASPTPASGHQGHSAACWHPREAATP